MREKLPTRLLTRKQEHVGKFSKWTIHRNFPANTKTAFLFIIFGNRKTLNRGRVFHLFRLFHLREWNFWRARIAEIVVIDLDELWTFIQE